MDITLHIKIPKDMLQNLVEAAIKHRCRRPATDVKRGYRLIAKKTRIEVNFLFDGSCIHFSRLRLINLLVVWAVRTYLSAERNMKIESKFTDILKLPFKALVGRNLVFKYHIVLFGQQSPNLVPGKTHKRHALVPFSVPPIMRVLQVLVN